MGAQHAFDLYFKSAIIGFKFELGAESRSTLNRNKYFELSVSCSTS